MIPASHPSPGLHRDHTSLGASTLSLGALPNVAYREKRKHGGTMIERLFPDIVESDEALVDVDLATLFAAERRVIASAVPKRQNEFATVRHCARNALTRLGVAPAAILPGLHREPQWPQGVVGSMTHCAGYRAAVVARASDVLTLGVDAEPHRPLSAEVIQAAASEVERQMLTHLHRQQPTIHWDCLLFCAKEAIYKAWFPLTASRLDFLEVHVELEPDGRFDVDLRARAPELAAYNINRFSGRWSVQEGLAIVSICVTR